MSSHGEGLRLVSDIRVSEALVDCILVRFEPQVQDYVEVRNPQNMVQLLEVLSKFQERYSCKAIRGSRNSDNVDRRSWNEHRMSNVDNSWRNWRNSEVLRRPNNVRSYYKGNYENGHQEINGSTAGIDFIGMTEI
ncbi:uncharacterized protein TNCV_1393761 [Trichonephila clavipes]|nr:uncharacterized protein TNCV_1393761 [Trichonephila clavipes]